MPTEPPVLAERVVFVLVEPLHPGNVGATARAMKNMDLRQLALVAPPAYDPERARWMAPGCADLLGQMRIVADLDQALVGTHRAVATTARHRRDGQRVLEPRQLAEQLLDDPEDRVTAILFGREDFGLSREHVRRCDDLLRIPTPEHASLNLAQAVMVVAHDLFEAARSRGLVASGRMVGGRKQPRATRALRRTGGRERRADLPEMEPAVQELVELLVRVGYTRSASPEKVALTARQALQSAGLSLKQVDALRGMVSRIGWALDHPELDWKATRRRHE